MSMAETVTNWRWLRLLVRFGLVVIVLDAAAVRSSVVLDVTRHGLIATWTDQDQTPALQALLDAAPVDATVVIPQGVTITTGPLRLKSHLTFQVDGRLQAIPMPELLVHDTTTTNSQHPPPWPQLPPLRIYGSSQDYGLYYQYQALLYASNVTHLRITGTGVIDGRGDPWWQAFMNHSLPVGRPHLVQIVDSSEIEIDSVTLIDSAFWTVHVAICHNVYIHHTTIRSRLYAPNVDGIDPDSCRNVLIEYNDISTGDDHISIKAGVCNGLWSPNQCTDWVWQYSDLYATTNVTVRYNTLRTGMGIAVGSATSGGIRNVHIHDNVVGLCEHGDDQQRGCGWGPALHLKTTMTRGNVMENISFHRNIVYNTSMFILLEMSYQSSHDKAPSDYAPTMVRNISFTKNRALGMAIGAHFECTISDACHDIVVHDNSIAGNAGKPSPWSCNFIESYNVARNLPAGLEDCMARSMNHSLLLKNEDEDDDARTNPQKRSSIS